MIRQVDLPVGKSGHTDALASHNSLRANKRKWVHTILNNRMRSIVVVQVIDISLRLMRKMLVMELKMIVGITTWVHDRGLLCIQVTTYGRAHNGSNADTRNTHQGQLFDKMATIHLSCTHIVDHIGNSLRRFLFFHN